jgi:rfaE bifunctional protein kinase chain/domain
MKTFNEMSDSRLEEILSRFGLLRIAIVGDFFLDKYLDVEPDWAEFSIETGKTAHQVASIRRCPGAAGTVTCNLAALGTGTLHALGFTGDDGEGFDLRKGLHKLGCTTDHLHTVEDRMTPTYLKPRDRSKAGLESEHERYDTKNRQRTSGETVARLIESLDELLPHVDAVIILDQVEEANCGVVTSEFLEAVAERAPKFPNVIFWGDSRLRVQDFRNVTIKPNQFEAMGVENPPPGYEINLDELAEAAKKLRAKVGGGIFATRGENGIFVSMDEEPVLVPGVPVEGPTDPTGAGDSATAGAVLSLAAGASPAEAALVANLVASITVTKLATTGTADPKELPARLARWRANL